MDDSQPTYIGYKNRIYNENCENKFILTLVFGLPISSITLAFELALIK